MKIYALDTYLDNVQDFNASIVLVVIATVFLLLRLWARRARKVKLWVDDYTIIADLACLYGLFAIEIADFKYGMRTHVTEIPAENLELLLKILVAYQILYGTSILLGKISYVFFYRRIFVSQSFLNATWVILAISIGWFIANILQVFLICRPFESNWDVTISAVCGNRPAAFTAIGAIHMVIDVAIMLLPVHYIRQLQMPMYTKFGICLIFLVGLSICAVSITRMIILSKLDFNDISFDMLDSVFWTVVEPALVIINACMPTTWPLLQNALSTVWEKVSTVTGTNSRKLDNDEYPLSPVVEPRNVSHAPQVVALAERRGIESRDGDDVPELSKMAAIGQWNTEAVRNRDSTLSGGVHVKTEWSITSR